MTIDPTLLDQTVIDLLDRHGTNALAAAQERLRSASQSNSPTAVDFAMVVLSEVERRLSTTTSKA
jgi:hypothetical protein